MAFESKDDAKMQSEMNNRLKKRNPVGNVDNREFEREKMKEEVESYPDGIVVNWSDLAFLTATFYINIIYIYIYIYMFLNYSFLV